MTTWQQRIEMIMEAADRWLNKDAVLSRSVDKTAGEGLFTRQDIEFSLNHIRNTVTKETLTDWCIKAGADRTGGDPDKTVLCLHAGNLPLVGFQDVMAVLLSGYHYAGKISKKDPYLLPGFLDALSQSGFTGDLKHSPELDNYRDLHADVVMFSGSGDSAKQVKERISKLGIARDDTAYLIRTASFSMVYLDKEDDGSLSDLAEAILRYEGKGCRSVAMVVSPCEPDELIERLEGILERFWENNPPIKVLTPKTKYRQAYNTALGKKQHLFRHLLIQQHGVELDNDDVIFWIKGDQRKAGKLAKSNLTRLQNIYTVNENLTIPEFGDHIQPLSSAQTPPIDWQPDGIDPLSWLVLH
ncbi:MAG: acyl-CoA reductase [Balneolales bacterium]